MLGLPSGFLPSGFLAKTLIYMYMLDSFALLTLSQWGNYETVHFMYYESPLPFALPVHAWRNNHFLGLCTACREPIECCPCDLILYDGS